MQYRRNMWQIVESSNGEFVFTAPVKDEKEWQDWLQDFQLKLNSAWVASNKFPSCSRATVRKGYVCQHSDFKNLSTVANGARIQSVRRNFRLRLNR
jgi:hypothetical protein